MLEPKRDRFHLGSFVETAGPFRIEIHFLAIKNELVKVEKAKLVFDTIKSVLESY